MFNVPMNVSQYCLVCRIIDVLSDINLVWIPSKPFGLKNHYLMVTFTGNPCG